MTRKSVMGIFAHPDDEAFGTAGTLHRYSRTGVETALVCATRGEVGEISDPNLATPETLGSVREGEMREAGEIIGVDEVIFLGYRDGSLADASPTEAIGKIVEAIRRHRPQVIITFDANGGYGHTDHMAIHRFTIEAFHQAGNPDCYPEQIEQGLEPWTPQKLYATAMSRSAMAGTRTRMEELGVNYSPGGNAATIPLDQMGTPDERITTIIPLSDEELEVKLRTMRAHRTQMSPRGIIANLPPDALHAWLGTERFVLLEPAGVPAASEHDLFANVDL